MWNLNTPELVSARFWEDLVSIL